MKWTPEAASLRMLDHIGVPAVNDCRGCRSP